MLDVKPNDRGYAVVNAVTGTVVRQYPEGMHAAAWDHAVWSEHNHAKRVPVVGPGGWFRAPDKIQGWTSDPRQAKTKSLAVATPEEIKAARQAAARFIQAHVRDDPMEVFLPDPEQEAGVATEAPEMPAESPAEVPAGKGTESESEALREALSESERQAFDNFTELAAEAPTESARKFWAAKADAIVKGSRVD